MAAGSRSAVRLVLASILAATVVAVVACGSDDDRSSANSDQDQKVEKAFLTGMAHHHETAIEMVG